MLAEQLFLQNVKKTLKNISGGHLFYRILGKSMKHPSDKFSLIFLFSIFSKQGEIAEIQKQPPQEFYKKETSTQVFSYEYCEMYKNTYYKEHLQTVASRDTKGIIVKLMKICIMKAEIFCIMKVEIL